MLLQVFRLPLPGVPVVTGSYGELRGTTLHLGIDFGVGERIGEVPVLAAGLGYVYRIRVSHTGYGKVLYVQHPNGLRTVYGHLSHFAPRGEEIVGREQARQRRFEVEVYLPAGAWPVKGGDTLGWAGNSGYSFGPHLHFEVRNQKDETLSPYPYLGLTDSIPPVFIRLGLVTLSPASAVAGRGGYYFFRLGQRFSSTVRRVYYLRDTFGVKGEVGVVYTVADRMGWSRAWSGVAEVILRKKGGDTLYRVRWDTLSYDVRRYLSWHVDEPYNQIYRVGIERLYRIGPSLSWTQGNGIIRVKPGTVACYEVVARDFLGNEAVVEFVLRGEAGGEAIRRVPLDPAREWSIEHGILLARRPYEVVFADGSWDSVAPWKPLLLGGRQPVRLRSPTQTHETHMVAILYPGHAARLFLGNGCELEVFPESLLDTLYLRVLWRESPWGKVLEIGDSWVPLRTPGILQWDLSKIPLRADQVRRAIPLYRGRQGGWDVVQGYRLRGQVMEIPLRRWGSFIILVDSFPPMPRPLRKQGPFYLVQIEDFGSGVDPYTLRVEPLMLPMEPALPFYPEYYLPQRRLYLPRKAGRAFRLSVRDKVGNTLTKVMRF